MARVKAAHLSIRAQVIGLGVLLAVLPVLLFAYISVRESSAALRQAARQSLEEEIQLTALHIDTFIENRIVDARVLSQADVFEGDRPDRIGQYLAEIVEASSWVNALEVADLSGRVLAHSGGRAESVRHIEDRYTAGADLVALCREARQGDVFVGEVQPFEHELGFIVMTPITDDTNTRVEKILVMEINLTVIEQLLLSFDQGAILDKQMHLVEKDGVVIASEDPGMKTQDVFPDVKVQPALQDRIALQDSAGSLIYTDSRGEQAMVAYADLASFGENQGLDWSAIGRVSLDAVTRPARATGAVLFGVGVAIILGSLMLALFIARRVTRPIRQTVQFLDTQHLGGGLDRMNVSGAREVQRWSTAYNALVSRIEAGIRAIQQAQAEQQRAQTLLNAYWDNAPSMIFIKDTDGRFLHVNRRTEEVWGVRGDEVLGKTDHDLRMVPEELADKFSRDEQAVLTDRRLLEIEEEVTIQGARRTLLVQKFPLFDAGGKPYALCGIATDITERKQAEEALRKSEIRYRALFDDAPISLWENDFSAIKTYVDDLRHRGITNVQAYFERHPEEVLHIVGLNRVLAFNEATLSLFEAESKEALLDHLQAIAGDKTLKVYAASNQAIADGKTRFIGEIINYTLTGQTLHLAMTWTVVPGHEDTYSRVLVALADITAQVSAEDELRALSRRLVRAHEEERRRMAQELHDEVGGLLTMLQISLRMQADEMEAPEAVEEAIALVDNLTDEIRALSLSLRPSALDDLGLIPALESLFSRYTARTGIRIDFQCEFDAEERFDRDIETAAYRVAQEALTNVARYADVTQAQVLLQDEGVHLALHITDEGEGFDPAQVLAERRSTGVTGMRERVVLLDGHFEIAAQPGAGTRVSAVLPR